jgi:hypothetical protein
VKQYRQEGCGLIIFTQVEEDRKKRPSYFTQVKNFAGALAKHVADGSKLVSLEVLEERMEICTLRPERSFDKCGACGCPLDRKLPWASEECGRAKKKPPEEPLWRAETDPARLAQ